MMIPANDIALTRLTRMIVNHTTGMARISTATTITHVGHRCVLLLNSVPFQVHPLLAG